MTWAYPGRRADRRQEGAARSRAAELPVVGLVLGRWRGPGQRDLDDQRARKHASTARCHDVAQDGKGCFTPRQATPRRHRSREASKYLILAIVNGLHTVAIHFSHVFSPTSAIRFDLGAVRGGKLDVVPQGMHVPAVEIVELGQRRDLAVLGHRGIDHRDKRSCNPRRGVCRDILKPRILSEFDGSCSIMVHTSFAGKSIWVSDVSCGSQPVFHS